MFIYPIITCMIHDVSLKKPDHSILCFVISIFLWHVSEYIFSTTNIIENLIKMENQTLHPISSIVVVNSSNIDYYLETNKPSYLRVTIKKYFLRRDGSKFYSNGEVAEARRIIKPYSIIEILAYNSKFRFIAFLLGIP